MEHARPPSELCLEGGPAARADAWRNWYKQFNVFLKASGVHKEPKDVQASLLINLVGAEGYDVYSTFKFKDGEKEDDFDLIVNKFNEHFGTKQNTTMSRFKFFTRQQQSGESIDEYVTALKILSKTCEFDNLEESLIRDRIVCGVNNSTVRDRLLRADDLTLTSAVKICQASEMSNEEKRQIEGIKTGDNGSAARSVDAVYGGRGRARFGGGDGGAGRGPVGGRTRQPAQAAYPVRPAAGGQAGAATAAARPCDACASAYCDSGIRCAAKRMRCFWCGERGHFKKMCPRKNKKCVYEVVQQDSEYEDCDDSEELYYISTIDAISSSKDSNKWYEKLTFTKNDQQVKFKLDTGSDLNVISYHTFQKLGLQDKILQIDYTKAQSFCGNLIPILGSCVLKWNYKNKNYMLHCIVAKHNCENVLGKHSCEELGLVYRILSINIEEYDDLFQGLGKLPGKYNICIEQGVQPSVCPVRKIPIGVRDKLLIELNRMERLGVIRKVTHPTPWVNAIVVASKKNGEIRVCLDPRPLNKVVRRAHYPLPTLTEIATKLEGAKYFSKLDARSGFWMVEITDASADLCTFGTPFGRYQFLRLPYGINCASEVFHAKVRQLLEDLDGVDSFVDDVIVWGSTMEEHDARLGRLLERARQIGIKFNRDKCEFGVRQVSYLGHTFNAKGMSIDNNKLKAIKEMPCPNDKASLERFLGMVNYLAKFIPNYSDVSSPLRSLLKKDVMWYWDGCHEAAVQRLKDLVCSAPVLALYNPKLPVLLSVDASAHALGAVLLQNGRPVEFASSTLTDTQTRYAQIEKELLAIVFALERFHQYIFGRQEVTVETDHKPLEALFKKNLDSVPMRLQRMMLRIQGYDFKVTYKPGKYMFVADTLSRAPLLDKLKDSISEEVAEQSCFLIKNIRFSDSKQRMIRDELARDEESGLIIKYIQKGWPENKYETEEQIRSLWSYKESLAFVDGLIFKDNLIYIPKCLRSEMINRVHDGHMGIDRCKRQARDVMFWPGMSREIEQCVLRCATCAERAARPAREPLLPHAIPQLPWAKVGSDIFQYGNQYFLLLVDYYSNFIEVNPLKSIGSKPVIAAMKDQFARHGIPKELITDNGPAYSSKEFMTFSKTWGFDHTTTSPNYPQSNGRSERSVRTLKNLLAKSIAAGTDFYLGLLNFRSTPRDGMGSPSQLLMGRKLNTRLPSHDDKLMPNTNHTTDYEKILLKQNIMKKNYDIHSRSLPELQTGEPVILLDSNGRKHGTVHSRADQPRSYFVADSTGKCYRRNRRHIQRIHTSSPYTSEEEVSRSSEEFNASDSRNDFQDPSIEEEWLDSTWQPQAESQGDSTDSSQTSPINKYIRTQRPAAARACELIKNIFTQK